MEKARTIMLLNQDLEGEHGAIIQYLNHAYAIGEGEMACEIEAIAREEMRHLDWLAETIVGLGGTPSLQRGNMRLDGNTVAYWMKNDVSLEEGAITLYREHIATIDDPGLKRLLERILSDEEAHHGQFEHFVTKAEKTGARDLRGARQDKTAKTLNWAMEHEYTVILQYMLQSYLVPKADAKKELEDQAINEMQHLGWLAENLVSSGGHPRLEHIAVDRSTRLADMLRADIEIENRVADAYEKAVRETGEAGLQQLFRRLRDHERYHAEVFGDLLKKEK